MIGVIVPACNTVATEEATTGDITTPVTITGISHEPLQEFVELNATSSFLIKNYIKANATGYLRAASIKPGQQVKAGQVLFTIKTKEAESLGNTITILDSSFRFSGVNSVKTNTAGFIAEVNHQDGEYVQDGEQLAVITDINSFVFLLDLPYEVKALAPDNKRLQLFLPGGDSLTGIVSSAMPVMDSVTQTQRIVIKVANRNSMPENLIARVRLTKPMRPALVSIPKAALLSNETQTEFWIMKLTDSSTAIKVPVVKGIEMQGRVEIISPPLSDQDRIVITGNYGLPDTAHVTIIR
jgi:multidrug efflux pump subunit AcrA (membrane-fusion protein)